MSAERLDAVLADLRSAAPPVDLWTELVKALAMEEAEVAQLLQLWHGVSVMDDDQWRQCLAAVQASRGSERADAWVGVQLEGQNYWLCPDPWALELGSAWSRMAATGARLAWAKPKQWKQLQDGMRDRVEPRSTTVPENPSTSTESPTSASHGTESAVVQFVDHAIAHAWQEGASDIHFETDRSGVGIKYRLDGVMVAGERLADPQKAREVLSRIKVMAQLDITEQRRPQDGRIHWLSRVGDAEVSLDLRVSVMPSIFGEDAVLRLLDKARLQDAQSRLDLDALGFDADMALSIRDLAQRPHGMLLITGPTGSGKTTTVYAALSEVNDGLEKIITIEDPVEYELPGVLQIPVNEQKGLTFATGLRSILRHDPDKILVGEIRDAETAQIALQSALTGHLVFTTVHANSLFDVLGRFQHFEIDPFALASALNGVVVQRLLRKLCPHCTTWRAPTPMETQRLQTLQLSVPQQLPVPCGCAHCRQSGYRGRFVCAEVHVLGDAVRDLIARKATLAELRAALSLQQTQRLLAKALEKVASGITSLEEVSRVVGLV